VRGLTRSRTELLTSPQVLQVLRDSVERIRTRLGRHCASSQSTIKRRLASLRKSASASADRRRAYGGKGVGRGGGGGSIEARLSARYYQRQRGERYLFELRGCLNYALRARRKAIGPRRCNVIRR